MLDSRTRFGEEHQWLPTVALVLLLVAAAFDICREVLVPALERWDALEPVMPADDLATASHFRRAAARMEGLYMAIASDAQHRLIECTLCLLFHSETVWEVEGREEDLWISAARQHVGEFHDALSDSVQLLLGDSLVPNRGDWLPIFVDSENVALLYMEFLFRIQPCLSGSFRVLPIRLEGQLPNDILLPFDLLLVHHLFVDFSDSFISHH